MRKKVYQPQLSLTYRRDDKQDVRNPLVWKIDQWVRNTVAFLVLIFLLATLTQAPLPMDTASAVFILMGLIILKATYKEWKLRLNQQQRKKRFLQKAPHTPTEWLNTAGDMLHLMGYHPVWAVTDGQNLPYLVAYQGLEKTYLALHLDMNLSKDTLAQMQEKAAREYPDHFVLFAPYAHLSGGDESNFTILTESSLQALRQHLASGESLHLPST